jgi:PAS domain S-box-containing protein
MAQTLNILMIENSEADYLFLERHLRQQGLFAVCFRIDSMEALERSIDIGGWDLILSDYGIPGLNFNDSFAFVKSREPELPVILVSGSIGEESAVELLKLGVLDYILKENLTRLVPAILRSIHEVSDRRNRMKAEEALQQSEERFRILFMDSRDALMTLTPPSWQFASANPATLKMFGAMDEAEFTAIRPWEVSPEFQPDGRLSGDKAREMIEIALSNGYNSFEWRHKRVNGEDFAAEVMLSRMEIQGKVMLQASVRDISLHQQAKEAQDATVELLHICNNADGLPALMQDLMRFFQKLTGCEAIGVRLRDGDDFPYYATRGFSDEFVQAEKYLCSYNPSGELVRDYTGHPVLDCLCGNILCSHLNPSASFFTPHGSYWYNCINELQADSPDINLQTKLRNRCSGEGFESVALIPFRFHEETLGLLQLNDRKKNHFTRNNIILYENLADHLAIALSKLKSDEALRESEQFNLQIINNAEEGIVVYGPDLRYLGWNPYMERLTGLYACDVIGRHPLELFPFLKEGGVIDRLEMVLKGLPVLSVEFPFHSLKSGYSGWASDSSSPLKNAAGEIIGGIAMVRDITLQKQADDTLRKLYVAVEQSPAVVMITDIHGKIEYVNQRFTQSTGYSVEEALNQNPRIEKGDTPAEIHRSLWATISKGDVWEGTFHNKRKDGSLFWEQATISPIRNDFGEITHFMAIKEDISEKLSLEEQLRQSQKMEAIGLLSAGIAHEINTPISFISSNLGSMHKYISRMTEFIEWQAEVIGSQCSELVIQEHEQRKNSLKIDRIVKDMLAIVEESQEGVDRIKMIVGNLKNFARKDENVFAEANLNELIKSTITIVWNEIKYVASLDKEFGEIPVIRCYPSQINQVIMNLLVNAAQAIDRSPGTITIRTWADEDQVYFEVCDNGCGISTVNKNRLFTPFFTTKEAGKGTGLGLSISAGIIHKHGGEITVVSEVGSGTIFTVRLPIHMPLQQTIQAI